MLKIPQQFFTLLARRLISNAKMYTVKIFKITVFIAFFFFFWSKFCLKIFNDLFTFNFFLLLKEKQ